MKHVVLRWVGMLSWLITALAAINVGLRPMNFDFFSTEFMLVNMPQFIEPLQYLILIAGLISLALFVMSLTGSGCSCNNGCGCK
jgi:hypothetical protein